MGNHHVGLPLPVPEKLVQNIQKGAQRLVFYVLFGSRYILVTSYILEGLRRATSPNIALSNFLQAQRRRCQAEAARRYTAQAWQALPGGLARGGHVEGGREPAAGQGHWGAQRGGSRGGGVHRARWHRRGAPLDPGVELVKKDTKNQGSLTTQPFCHQPSGTTRKGYNSKGTTPKGRTLKGTTPKGTTPKGTAQHL